LRLKKDEKDSVGRELLGDIELIKKKSLIERGKFLEEVRHENRVGSMLVRAKQRDGGGQVEGHWDDLNSTCIVAQKSGEQE